MRRPASRLRWKPPWPTWQPREANVLSDKLEDVLDDLERAFVA